MKTKQKKIAYLTLLFYTSEHFGDFDFCFSCAVDSLNYSHGYELSNKTETKKFFLDYVKKCWGYNLSTFID